MKKKIVVLLISAMLVCSAYGCGSAAESQSQENSTSQQEAVANNTSGTTETVNSEDFEVREITEREWEEMAVITLGTSVEIQGSGAEVLDTVLSITEGGSYEITGTWTDGMIYIETDEAVRLVLNNASITSTTGPAIYAYDSEEVWIVTADGTENALVDATEYNGVYAETTTADATAVSTTDTAATTETATEETEEEAGKGTIFSNDDLIFAGNGTLTVTGNSQHGICSDDSVYFQSGAYVISAVKDGVHTNDVIAVNGGTITVTQANDGMESEGVIVFNDGSYTADAADDGISATGNFTMNGGTITINSCEEGVESKANLYVNGGTIAVTGNDDGLNGGTLVQINDGIVYTNVVIGDGVDSNGNLEINGGIVIALGGESPEGGADCDQNAFIITGGVLIATGGVNSSPTEASCTQASVLLGSAAAGNTIGIKDADGNTLFSFQVSKSYSNLLLSGGFLETNGTYTVYTGGTVSGEETAYGYYADAEYTGGTESISFTVDGMVISAGGTAGMDGGMQGGMGGMQGQFGDGTTDGTIEGERPSRGEMPSDGTVPEAGTMPENMTPPDGTEMPDGTTQQDSGNSF